METEAHSIQFSRAICLSAGVPETPLIREAMACKMWPRISRPVAAWVRNLVRLASSQRCLLSIIPPTTDKQLAFSLRKKVTLLKNSLFSALRNTQQSSSCSPSFWKRQSYACTNTTELAGIRTKFASPGAKNVFHLLNHTCYRISQCFFFRCKQWSWLGNIKSSLIQRF